MIWVIALAIVFYFVGLIVTATLLYLHIQDHPDWAADEGADGMDQILAAMCASVFWPVTLLVVATMKARSHWVLPEGPTGHEEDR